MTAIKVLRVPEGDMVPAPKFLGWKVLARRTILQRGDVVIRPYFKGEIRYAIPSNYHLDVTEQILRRCSSLDRGGWSRCLIAYRPARNCVKVKAWDPSQLKMMPVPNFPGYRPIPLDEPCQLGDVLVKPFFPGDKLFTPNPKKAPGVVGISIRNSPWYHAGENEHVFYRPIGPNKYVAQYVAPFRLPGNLQYQKPLPIP